MKFLKNYAFVVWKFYFYYFGVLISNWNQLIVVYSKVNLNIKIKVRSCWGFSVILIGFLSIKERIWIQKYGSKISTSIEDIMCFNGIACWAHNCIGVRVRIFWKALNSLFYSSFWFSSRFQELETLVHVFPCT